MSFFIIVSQTARLASVWTRSKITSQLLISVSIIAYSALLIERNKKINKYYERSDVDEISTRGSGENS